MWWHQSCLSSAILSALLLACTNDSAPSINSVFERVSKSVVFIETDLAVGSGVVLNDDGHIVTNAHVLAGSNAWRVTLPDGSTVEADIVGVNRRADIGVLELPNGSWDSAEKVRFSDTDSLAVGDEVLALGYPFEGIGDAPIIQMTSGIVSARRPDLYGEISYIQTDASLNHGISGGALVNAAGELVGMPSRLLSETSAGGLAIASDDVDRIARSIIDGERDLPPVSFFGRKEVDGFIDSAPGSVGYFVEATKGDLLAVTVRSDQDVYMELLNAASTELDYVDELDVPGEERLEFEIGFTGSYVLLVSSFEELDVVSFHVSASHVLRTFTDEEDSHVSSVGDEFTGELQYPGDDDTMRIRLSAGDEVNITARSWDFDGYLSVEAPSGETYQDDDSALGPAGADPRVKLVAEEDGYYRITLSGYAQTEDYGAYAFGFYKLTISAD